MTENMTPQREAGAERLRCQSGSATSHPCWREATERIRVDALEPEVCAEHAEAIRLGLETDALVGALDKLSAWIEAEVHSRVETPLQNPIYHTREKLEEDFWRAHVAERAADLIAEAGPDEERMSSPEEAGKLAELLECAHAVCDARGVLYDVPDEAFGSRGRWLVIAGLTAVSEMLSEEVGRYKREIGVPGEEARGVMVDEQTEGQPGRAKLRGAGRMAPGH